MTCGKKLRLARIEKEVKLREVAEELNVTPQAISYLERNKDTLLIKYLKYLKNKGVDINKLFEI